MVGFSLGVADGNPTSIVVAIVSACATIAVAIINRPSKRHKPVRGPQPEATSARGEWGERMLTAMTAAAASITVTFVVVWLYPPVLIGGDVVRNGDTIALRTHSRWLSLTQSGDLLLDKRYTEPAEDDEMFHVALIKQGRQ